MTGAQLGAGTTVADGATLVDGEDDQSPPVLGSDAVVRSGTIVYPDVVVGDRLQTGHDVVVRSGTRIGDDALLGTKTVVDGEATIGDGVRMQTGVYVPPETTIRDRVFLGPCATLTNDPYPLRRDVDLEGPTLEADVTIGANATILPGVTVGERAFVAAGAVVAEDVPPESLAVGTPAEIRSLPEKLAGENDVP